MNGSLIVRGGRLIDAASRSAIATDVLIIDGAIAELGPPGLAAPPDAAVFDASRTLMHPGLVNSHTHSSGNFGKGTADRRTLELLLVHGNEGFASQSAEDKYLGAYIGAVEMLTKGCATCYDLTYALPYATVEDLFAVGQAYRDAGMRAVVAPMISDISLYRAIPGLFDALPDEAQRALAASTMDGADVTLATMRRALHGWPHDRDRVKLGVAPTIPLHCSDALTAGAATLAREYATVIQSHVAESKVQAVAALRRWRKSLVAHIDELGLLGPDFTVAHGVWLDDDDMRRLAGAGVTVAHNPGSNMRLGSGIADARRMLELGLTLALGTEGASSSDNQNMYEAMRCASLASNVRGPDYRRWLSAPEIVAAATKGGASATGFAGIGRIASGYRADIVFLDADAINWIPTNDPANQLVLTEDATSVKHVMVDGEVVVRDGAHVSADLPALAAGAEAVRARLRRDTAPLAALNAAIEEAAGHFCIGLCRAPHHLERYATPNRQP